MSAIRVVFKTARDDDGFRQALRNLGATKRRMNFTFEGSLSWPVEHWYGPEDLTPQEMAVQDTVLERRAQGLADKINDPSLLGRLAAMLNRGTS